MSGAANIDERGVPHRFAFEARDANLRYRFEEALEELDVAHEPAPRHLASIAEAARVARADRFGHTAWRVLFRQSPPILRICRRMSPKLEALAAEYPAFFAPLDV